MQNKDAADGKAAMETLISCLDKRIDDMEVGRVQTVGEAFQIDRDRVNLELLNTDVR